jgi:glycine cleavage system transcriptional repressor
MKEDLAAMRTDIVFTLTGPDRVGLVEEVTDVLLGLGGNVETSRMARLAGEFAILMQVSLDADPSAGLDRAFDHLTAEGYKVTWSRSEGFPAERREGWVPFRIEVHGADHEGIVHEIAAGLSRAGINIESAETETTSAPISATPLFSMTALVLVPPTLSERDWREALEEAGRQLNVDVTVTPAGE